jgi:hypothetical protein
MIKVIIAAVIVGVVFGAGYKLADWKAEAEWNKALAEQAAKFDKIREEWRERELELLDQEQEIITRVEVQEREVIRYVEATGNRECLDTAGIELFNQITTSPVSGPADLP